MRVTRQRKASLRSRRDFLATSASAALVAGTTGRAQSAPEAPSGPVTPASTRDLYALAVRFSKFLRVTDVVDGLDAVGRADLTLLDPGIRPLWMGMKFWGPAVVHDFGTRSQPSR